MTVYIEHEGMLYRGPARAWPQEQWNHGRWLKYDGPVPKDVEWGDLVDEAEAEELKAYWNERHGVSGSP
jgi:hypothetical protein